MLVWGQINDAQVPDWHSVFYFNYTPPGMMFGGAPFASVAFSGLDGYDTNDPPIDWKEVDDEETTNWQLIAA